MGLAHPYGWAVGQEGAVHLRQYPGTLVEPGKRFESMEAVFGVAKQGEARTAFLDHLKEHMRRTRRGHDGPYAIFEPLGSQPGGDNTFYETEEFVLDNLVKVGASQRDSDCHFDYYPLDFWVDYQGDLTTPDPQRLPHGFDRIKAELRKLHTHPRLRIGSSWELWSVGGNPAVKPTLSNDPQFGTEWMALCRATEPLRACIPVRFVITFAKMASAY